MKTGDLGISLYLLGVAYCYGNYDRSDPWSVIAPHYWKFGNLEVSVTRDFSYHYLFNFFASECRRVMTDLSRDYGASFSESTANKMANRLVEGYLSAASNY